MKVMRKNKIINNKVNKNAHTQANTKRNAGITLIALVITIIIIIILASITINFAFGDNGLINMAEEARDLAANSTDYESNARANLVSYMNEFIADLNGGSSGGGTEEPEEDITPPVVAIQEGAITSNSIEINVSANDPESGLASENPYVYYLNGEEKGRNNTGSYKFEGLTAETQYTIKVEVYNGVGIKGEDSITVSTTSKTVENSKGEKFDNTTQIEDESGDTVWIPGGFEIAEDSANDADDGVVIQDSNGNQFVWIPVKDESKFQRYEGYQNGSLASILSDCSEPFANGYSTEKTEYDAMVSSVKTYDGFYVGRYEAGTTNANRSSSSGISDAVVVKKDAYVYNYVGWSDSDSMNDETGGAVEISKKFASANGYTTVTSTLIYGIQWDAVMNFIDPAYSTESCSETSFVRDSSGKGWYNQSAPTKTGYYAVKNIYDLGGNVYEWTMEANGTNVRVDRGGGYNRSGSRSPASSRYSSRPSTASDNIGFRLALYL